MVFIEGEDLTFMAQLLNLSPDDLPALVKKMPEWDQVEAEIPHAF